MRQQCLRTCPRARQLLSCVFVQHSGWRQGRLGPPRLHRLMGFSCPCQADNVVPRLQTPPPPLARPLSRIPAPVILDPEWFWSQCVCLCVPFRLCRFAAECARPAIRSAHTRAGAALAVSGKTKQKRAGAAAMRQSEQITTCGMHRPGRIALTLL